MIFVILIAILVVIIVYANWRHGRTKAARKKYEPLMPGPNRLSWAGSTAIVPFAAKPLSPTDATATNDPRPKTDFTVTVGPIERGRDVLSDFLKEPATWGAAADGAIAGGLLAQAALKIDPHVLSAIEFSTADHLHGLTDIDSYVHDHFFAVPIASADGWFERLSGYVAEQKAAAYFEHMGHHVEFAPVANQPVWDMLVDGHPVQIKESLTGVKEFVVQHHGVDVFTSNEIAAAVKDPAVHGLDVLDANAVDAATSNTIDGIHGTISPEFHFPLITLGFSSWREAKLLWHEKTTLDRALLHVGMDVAAVGGGGLVGAKAGAAIGTFFGPGVGTAIGAVVGGIIGGIGGKLTSTAVRMVPFKSAREDYNRAVTDAQSEVDRQIDDSKVRVVELQAEYQKRYLEARNEIERNSRQQIASVSTEFDRVLRQLCEAFPRFLGDLLQQLNHEEQKILSQVAASGVFSVVFPSDNDLYRGVVRAWFKRARQLVRQEVKEFKKLEDRSLDALHAEIQRFLKEYSFELKSMADELGRVTNKYEYSQRRAADIQRDAVKQTEEKRATLIQQFGEQVENVQRMIVGAIDRWNGVITYKRTELKKEAAAVGIDL